jgi:hypothetical protein
MRKKKGWREILIQRPEGAELQQWLETIRENMGEEQFSALVVHLEQILRDQE